MDHGIKRKKTWNQENPRDQVRVIVGAALGDLSNMKQGIGNLEKQIARIQGYLTDAEELLRQMPTGYFSAERK